MRVEHWMRSLLLGGVLIVGCSSDDKDTRQGKHPPSEDRTNSGGAAGSMSMPPPPPDLLTELGKMLDATGFMVCFAGGDACTPPTKAAAEKPDEVIELQITDTPERKEGEPSIAINPKNPNNLVMIYADFAPGRVLGEDAYNCQLEYSMDRGLTWTRVKPWPPAGTEPFPDCGESVIEVDADGTFYAGMNILYNSNSSEEGLAPNTDQAPHAVSKSTDGGRTWTKPVVTYKISGVIKARVDQVTGKLYHAVSEGGLFPGALTVSSDKGETWSKPVALPGMEYAVHDGIFMAAAEIPSIRVHVSTDDGQTYKQLDVKDKDGKVVPAGASGTADPSPWISADTTKTGRFAVLVPLGPPYRLQGFVPTFDAFDVYVTEDSGETWAGPAHIVAPWAANPWIEYGPTGALGVFWRGVSKDGNGPPMVDAYATVSFDTGKTFSPPLRLNSESHPWADSGPPADDWSGLSLDDEYLYGQWVDNRSGRTGDVIFARAPLALFRDAMKK